MAQNATYTVIQAATDPHVQQALAVILSTWGETASVLTKMKNVNKFGRNQNASATSQTVWSQGGDEVYLTSDLIDTMSSSSASDTGTVRLESHTLSGGNFTFLVQTPTLNGQTKVSITPVARTSRIANTGSADFVGDIYAYEDTAIVAGVPTDGTKIHAKAILGRGNTTLKCATTMSSVDYWLITGIEVSVLKKTAAFCEFSLQIREYGGVFRTVDTLSASNSSGSTEKMFRPFLIAPPNSDIRVICTADGSGTDVSAAVYGMLATTA